MSESTSQSGDVPRRSLVRRVFGSVPVLLLLLLVWAVALIWGVSAFALHQRPDLVRSRVDALLAEHCPTVSLSTGAMRPSLWPSPGIAMNDVLLREKDGTTLLAEGCALQFRWGDLFSGKLVPSRLSLHNATARIVLTASDTADAPAVSSTTPLLTELAALNGLTLDLNNVAVQLVKPDTPEFDAKIQGLTGTITAPSGAAAGLLGLEPGDASLRWADFSLRRNGALLRLRDARLTAESIRLSKDAMGLVRTGQVDLSVLADAGNPQNPALRNARIEFKAALALTAGPPDIRGTIGLAGQWQINGVTVPVSGTFPFGSRDVRTGIDIVDAALRMDTNEATLTATFLPDDLSLTGRLNVGRFSLPRWFAFARDLPDSLVDTLDNIHGSFTFRLTPQGLNAPDLKFSIKDMEFIGSGGVEDWKKPVIHISAMTDAADINRVFPELAEKPSASPTFNGPPLLSGNSSQADTPEATATPDVGFFIRLKAKEADFWKCTGKGFLLELSPIWSSSGNIVDGVKLTARLDQFYGGRLDATLNARNALRVNLNLRNVQAERLSRAATGQPHIGGSLTAEADLSGAGNSLAEFMAGLNGTLNATLDGGFFTSNGKKTPFQRLAVQANGLTGTSRKKPDLPSQLPYNARWRLEMTPPANHASVQANKPLSVTLDANGPLYFSTRFWLPVAAQNLPLRAVGVYNTVPFNLSGKITTAQGESKLAVADLLGRLAEADVSGNLTFSSSATQPDVRGTVAVSTSDLRRVLSRLGVSAFADTNRPGNTNNWPQTAFRRADIRAKVDFSNATLQLEDLRGSLDTTSFSGKLRVANGQRWVADLTLDSLNTAAYRNPTHNPATAISAKDTDPWPIDAMKALDVNADIRITRLQSADIIAENVRLPITLKDGRLSVSPITLLLGKAPQEASLRADVLNNALSMRFTSTVRNADLRSVWKPSVTSEGDSLGGLGNSTLNLYGLSRSPADIPACLNGTWSGNIQNGFLSTGKSRRNFTSLSASGAMTAGVLSSKDFLLSGQNFSVRGGGTVNLVNRTLNYRLTATLPGVPAVPIVYSGNLADPTRRINAFSTVASVLGNVGKGVFSLVDSFLSVPLNLLR